MSESPWQVLGIPKDSTEEEVREAYREKIKEAHPDVGGSEEEFKRIRSAYESIIEGETGSDSRFGDRVFVNATVEYLNFKIVQERGWHEWEAFELAGKAELDEKDYGSFGVQRNQYVLEAAEKHGLTWPYSCRGGACANCTVQLVEGDISTPMSHILSRELLSKDYRLSCIGRPLTKDIKIFYNVKIKDELQELLLPSRSEFEDEEI